MLHGAAFAPYAARLPVFEGDVRHGQWHDKTLALPLLIKTEASRSVTYLQLPINTDSWTQGPKRRDRHFIHPRGLLFSLD